MIQVMLVVLQAEVKGLEGLGLLYYDSFYSVVR